MKPFRFQLRLVIPLGAVLVIASILAFQAVEALTQRWFAKDLNLRATLVASALSDSISRAVASDHPETLRPLFDKILQDERLAAIGLCSDDGRMLLATQDYPVELSCEKSRQLMTRKVYRFDSPTTAFHVSTHVIHMSSMPDMRLTLLHDMAYVERRSTVSRQYLLIFVVALGIIIAIISVIAAHLSWNTWVKGVRTILRDAEIADPSRSAGAGLPDNLVTDIRARLRDLEDAYRRAKDVRDIWSAEQLGDLLKIRLRGDQVIVVSNREPWVHDRQKGHPEPVAHQPASGLVTALEPVVSACSGTWIAHGCGTADRETTDDSDHIDLPPGPDKRYRLRRLWLSPEEEKGYYDGMSNRGLWPLSHLAHIQPVFSEEDWQHYQRVNQRFAEAVRQEARVHDPVVLIQDYHLALVPGMVRKLLPDATIITFWHIPWPNPESFSICPWRREIVEGLLGSTILGFQTAHHRHNFITTADSALEARIDHEHSIVILEGQETFIESYPISIAWPASDEQANWPPVTFHRIQFCTRYGIDPASKILLGVDRLEYTKGIAERLCAFEDFLERNPRWAGRTVLVQIAAPSRGHLDEYRDFGSRITVIVDRINRRFGRTGYTPVIFLAEFHEHGDILGMYRAADVCIVSSLHDGMNLVCKEFIAARDDEQGVLLLSQFAGASRELPEAIQINPYHREGMVSAIVRALEMPPAEQHERMAAMRMIVRENNVFRWAGRMLTDAARQRLRQRIEHRVRERHNDDT